MVLECSAGRRCYEWTASITVSYTHLDVYKRQVLADAENVELETQRIEVGGISENDLLSLNKSLKRGTLDYDELVHSNGIIFTWDILFEQYGFEIGDTIQLLSLIHILPRTGREPWWTTPPTRMERSSTPSPPQTKACFIW